MTYFGFLSIFLVIPILLLAGLSFYAHGRARSVSSRLQSWPAWGAILLHVAIALAYTTPWDNYLVATHVWWYDPYLVTGITIGWVPIEEYTFFVLQPILAGLWLLLLARSLAIPDSLSPPSPRLRLTAVSVVSSFWIGAVAVWLSGWQPGTYLALELGWALPPIALQLAFGADILWHYRRLVSLTILPLTLYLSTADALAIDWGTWTINPRQSLNVFLGGVLPVEEFLFFLLTNTLITFGVILLLAQESHVRIDELRQRRMAPHPSTPASK